MSRTPHPPQAVSFPQRGRLWRDHYRASVYALICTDERNKKAPCGGSSRGTRVRESACTKRFDGSVVKRSKTLFSQSPPPLRGAPSRREPLERSSPNVHLLSAQEKYIKSVGALHDDLYHLSVCIQLRIEFALQTSADSSPRGEPLCIIMSRF